MQSKNAKSKTRAEHEHIERVKALPCSVCDEPSTEMTPSDAHHIVQGDHFTVVALCKDCHQGSAMGWHGNRTMWKIRKLDEIQALNITLSRLAK